MTKPKKPKEPRDGETEIVRMPRKPTPEEFFGRLFAASGQPMPTQLNKITIPITDDMMEAAQKLKRSLTHEQHNALWEAILHIESMSLTVDASPAEEGERE